MAYEDKNFNAIGGQARSGVNGALFYYRTEDAEATVIAVGYFNEINSKLKKGDVIEVVTEVDDVDSPSSATGILKLMVSDITDNVVTVIKLSIL